MFLCSAEHFTFLRYKVLSSQRRYAVWMRGASCSSFTWYMVRIWSILGQNLAFCIFQLIASCNLWLTHNWQSNSSDGWLALVDLSPLNKTQHFKTLSYLENAHNVTAHLYMHNSILTASIVLEGACCSELKTAHILTLPDINTQWLHVHSRKWWSFDYWVICGPTNEFERGTRSLFDHSVMLWVCQPFNDHAWRVSYCISRFGMIIWHDLYKLSLLYVYCAIT